MYLADVGLNQQSAVVGGLAPRSVALYRAAGPDALSMSVYSVLRHCELDM